MHGLTSIVVESQKKHVLVVESFTSETSLREAKKFLLSSLEEFGVSEEEFEEWKENGSVRNYPLPDGYEGDIAQGMSPVTLLYGEGKRRAGSSRSRYRC